jgi:hypothetical protein
MFCPKCGGESLEGHKFCKACGANLQLVSDALSGGDDTLGQLRADMDNLKRSIVESSRSVGRAARKEWRRAAHQARQQGWGVHTSWASGGPASRGRDRDQSSKDTTLYDGGGEPEAMTFYDKRLPKPKEWLRYSRQHIVKEGLLSLLAGGAMGGVLYYLGHLAIESGTISDLEARGNVHGLEQIAAMVWILAAVPVVKGLGQMVYGLLFGESIKTLSQHFAPAIIRVSPPQQQQTGSLPNAARSQIAEDKRKAAVPTQEVKPFGPPPSVTEGTTNILGEMKQSESR